MSTLVEDLTRHEIDRLPQPFRRLVPEDDNYYPYIDLQSMAQAYGKTFLELAQQWLEHGEKKNFLAWPMLFAGRHSMELYLRWAIEAYQGSIDESGAKLLGGEVKDHHLGKLLSYLVELLEYVGVDQHHDYIRYCLERLSYINSIDPDGLQFAVPYQMQDQRFELAQSNLEDLIKAHWNVATYCRASVELLSELKEHAVEQLFLGLMQHDLRGRRDEPDSSSRE